MKGVGRRKVGRHVLTHCSNENATKSADRASAMPITTLTSRRLKLLLLSLTIMRRKREFKASPDYCNHIPDTVHRSEAYNAQLRRMEDLIKKKGEIEKVMAIKVAALRTNYNIHSDSLKKVIERRLEELR
jgi:hypothetical protein